MREVVQFQYQCNANCQSSYGPLVANWYLSAYPNSPWFLPVQALVTQQNNVGSSTNKTENATWDEDTTVSRTANATFVTSEEENATYLTTGGEKTYTLMPVAEVFTDTPNAEMYAVNLKSVVKAGRPTLQFKEYTGWAKKVIHYGFLLIFNQKRDKT